MPITSLKPPKEWITKLKKQGKDEQLIGWIWYHKLDDAKRSEVRKRYGKKYGAAASFVQKVLAQYSVVLGARASNEMEPPKAIADYIRGLDGLPSATDPQVTKYARWLQTKLDKPSYKVYRAFREYGEIGGEIFADSHPMSFTESKTTALAIAKERHEDDESVWVYVVEIDAPKKLIYFHHKFGGKLGAEHPKEKEVMVLAKGLPYKVIKEYEGE